ncbi:hypothetical protein GGX14DRAFT_658024 [Mycena pura]|uniref:F-box domain-containing protein n=1 Tax=Mycena pura TaxID=153505 RepID=A0AAD6YM37_9AGAR|nr:hypothetical protein GGX14DRAFT_658024 [Mycena pura]
MSTSVPSVSVSHRQTEAAVSGQDVGASSGASLAEKFGKKLLAVFPIDSDALDINIVRVVITLLPDFQDLFMPLFMLGWGSCALYTPKIREKNGFRNRLGHAGQALVGIARPRCSIDTVPMEVLTRILLNARDRATIRSLGSTMPARSTWTALGVLRATRRRWRECLDIKETWRAIVIDQTTTAVQLAALTGQLSRKNIVPSPVLLSLLFESLEQTKHSARRPCRRRRLSSPSHCDARANRSSIAPAQKKRYPSWPSQVFRPSGPEEFFCIGPHSLSMSLFNIHYTISARTLPAAAPSRLCLLRLSVLSEIGANYPILGGRANQVHCPKPDLDLNSDDETRRFRACRSMLRSAAALDHLIVRGTGLVTDPPGWLATDMGSVTTLDLSRSQSMVVDDWCSAEALDQDRFRNLITIVTGATSSRVKALEYYNGLRRERGLSAVTLISEEGSEPFAGGSRGDTYTLTRRKTLSAGWNESKCSRPWRTGSGLCGSARWRCGTRTRAEWGNVKRVLWKVPTLAGQKRRRIDNAEHSGQMGSGGKEDRRRATSGDRRRGHILSARVRMRRRRELGERGGIGEQSSESPRHHEERVRDAEATDEEGIDKILRRREYRGLSEPEYVQKEQKRQTNKGARYHGEYEMSEEQTCKQADSPHPPLPPQIASQGRRASFDATTDVARAKRAS